MKNRFPQFNQSLVLVIRRIGKIKWKADKSLSYISRKIHEVEANLENSQVRIFIWLIVSRYGSLCCNMYIPVILRTVSRRFEIEAYIIRDRVNEEQREKERGGERKELASRCSLTYRRRNSQFSRTRSLPSPAKLDSLVRLLSSVPLVTIV